MLHCQANHFSFRRDKVELIPPWKGGFVEIDADVEETYLVDDGYADVVVEDVDVDTDVELATDTEDEDEEDVSLIELDLLSAVLTDDDDDDDDDDDEGLEFAFVEGYNCS